MFVYNVLQSTLDFPHSSVAKESACNAGNPGLIPGLRGSAGEGIGYPLQYSGLENAMDCIVHGGHKDLDTTERPSLQSPVPCALCNLRLYRSCPGG